MLADDIRAKQSDLERLNMDIDEVEQQLRRDPYRDEYARMEKMLGRVERERAELEEEAAQTSLDPEEARAKLLAKARDDNNRLMQLGERLSEVQDTIARKRTVRGRGSWKLEAGVRGGRGHSVLCAHR